MRPTFDQIYMQMSVLIAERSTCSRSKVGCVIVSGDNSRVLSIGYNGGPKGLFNECQSQEAGHCLHLHAEANALLKLNYNEPCYKKVYVTMEPCVNCSIMLINSGIREVVYLNEYRLHEGLQLLQKASIKTRQFNKKDLLYAELNDEEDN
jgi:dCMP deaminase